MRLKRTLEETVILRLRLLTNWLQFWADFEREEPEGLLVMNPEIVLLQIEELQERLEELRAKMSKELKSRK